MELSSSTVLFNGWIQHVKCQFQFPKIPHHRGKSEQSSACIFSTHVVHVLAGSAPHKHTEITRLIGLCCQYFLSGTWGYFVRRGRRKQRIPPIKSSTPKVKLVTSHVLLGRIPHLSRAFHQEAATCSCLFRYRGEDN